MAQRSSPILPLTSGIGAVSPVNVGGPGSAEEAFRNEQGLLQRLFSGLGGGGNRAPSLSDISGGYYVDQRGAGSAIPSATSPAMSPSELDDFAGLSIGGAEGPSSVPTPSEIFSSLFRAGPAARPQANVRQPDDLVDTIPSPFDDLSGFNIDPRGSVGGTLFGDPVETTPAQAQETAGILTKLIQDSATRGGAEAAATDGKESSTNVQGDVTDITDQPDDLVETNPLFGAETATTTRSFGPDEQTTEQKKGSLYEGLLKQSLDSYNEMIGKAPSAAKTIEEYKQEFSEATGIDISGQPDNSAALTAFGLALMQNKAGKGFNVGELLSETGKAGEKALPLMVEARKEAKSGQIAAGQFALAQRATDSATRQKYLNEAETYIRNRRDAILGAEVARIQSIEDREDKQAAAKELELIKYNYDYNLKKIEAFNKINENKFKVTDKEDIVPLKNLPNIKITYGKSEADGRPRLLFPAQQVGQLGTALADIKEGQGSIDFMIGELELVKDQPGGINIQKAKEIAQGLAASFGYNINEVPKFNDKGEYIGTEPADKPLTDVTAVRDRLIAQFKRFLTQETGNGISNVDVKNVERLLGAIDFGGDPNTAIKRLTEVREIFNSSEDKLKVALKDFDNRDYYLSDEEYALTRGKISDAIVASYNLRGNAGASDPDAGSAFDFTVDADGVRTYKMF